jgi:hypothetical protein
MTLPKIAALQNIDRTKVLKGITYAGLAFVVLDLGWFIIRGSKKINRARR